jgi:hypothetical protein
MLAALGFVKVFRTEVERVDIRSDLNKLEGLANQRLSAAMVGLVRSFTINAFDMEVGQRPGSVADGQPGAPQPAPGHRRTPGLAAGHHGRSA